MEIWNKLRPEGRICWFAHYTASLSSLSRLIWKHWTNKMVIMHILSNVCLRLGQFSLIFHAMYGAARFQLTHCSELWTIMHSLWLYMVRVGYFDMFLLNDTSLPELTVHLHVMMWNLLMQRVYDMSGQKWFFRIISRVQMSIHLFNYYFTLYFNNNWPQKSYFLRIKRKYTYTIYSTAYIFFYYIDTFARVLIEFYSTCH